MFFSRIGTAKKLPDLSDAEESRVQMLFNHHFRGRVFFKTVSQSVLVLFSIF